MLPQRRFFAMKMCHKYLKELQQFDSGHKWRSKSHLFCVIDETLTGKHRMKSNLRIVLH